MSAANDQSADVGGPDLSQGPELGGHWHELDRDLLGMHPLRSKLRPPQPQLDVVPRRTLVDALLSSSAPLVLLSASAGYGKTNALLRVTEGWATGLYLALLAGEGRAVDDWLPRVHGSQREIAGYLTAEVLERQPDELQSFLMQTSILERLSPPLCRAVTGRADADRLLARLVPRRC